MSFNVNKFQKFSLLACFDNEVKLSGLVLYSLSSCWYEPSINLCQELVMLSSSELSLQKTLSSVGKDKKIFVVSSLAYGDLICLGASKVDFKSQLLFPMKHIYVTILHLLCGLFLCHVEWRHILFSSVPGRDLWLDNLVTFYCLFLLQMIY